jgi:hypothetical protein
MIMCWPLFQHYQFCREQLWNNKSQICFTSRKRNKGVMSISINSYEQVQVDQQFMNLWVLTGYHGIPGYKMSQFLF